MVYHCGEEISAGGIVARRGAQGWELVLITRKNRSVWCLPKGKIEPGETPEQAALREVFEETGVTAAIAEFIEIIEYAYTDAARSRYVRKQVHFFLMKAGGGDLRVHDHPEEQAEWFTFAEALTRLSYPGERHAAQRGQELLARECADGSA
ncbi:MAG: NUDIX hydrolase [Candidatus Omnitrophica bacterium]|nr:NUDIX hydrolase [Candidatus Omnitrophota bacterium]